MSLFDRAREAMMTGQKLILKDKKEQNKEAIDIVAFVEQKINDIQAYGQRQTIENQWMTNSAYVIGYDSMFFDSNSTGLRMAFRTTAPMKSNQMRVNKILPALQRRTARICKNRPRYEILPDGLTDQAKDVARKEREILYFYWEKERIQEKRIQLTMLAQTHGHAYLKVCWDDMKGQEVQDPETGETMFEGDVAVEIRSAFNCYPDWQATNIENCRFFIEAGIKPLSYFRDKFEDGYLVEAESSASLTAMQYDQRIKTMHGQNASSGGTSEIKDSAVEKIYYEAKSKMRPRGRMITIANGVLLEDKDLPVGEIPFAKFDDIVVGGRYYPEAVVTHARPVQDQFTKLITRRADWCNKLIAGKYMAARGAKLAEDSLTNRSGECLYYDVVPNAAPPTAMNIPLMPQYVYQEEESLDRWLYDIMGESDISRGELPSASIPALGMQILLEVDASRMGIETEQHEHAFARTAMLILKYVEKYAVTERTMKKTTSSGGFEIIKYQGSDIKSSHDVVVIRGSLAPQSQAQRRNDIMNLFSAGLLGNPQDQNVSNNVFAALEFGDLDEFWKSRSLRVAQVKKTIEQIEQGVSPIVHELDDHPLHIQMKNDYRLSDKYDSLNPNSKAILLQNIEEHIQAQMRITAPSFGMPVDRNDVIGSPEENELNGNIMQADAALGEAQNIEAQQMGLATQGVTNE